MLHESEVSLTYMVIRMLKQCHNQYSQTSVSRGFSPRTSLATLLQISPACACITGRSVSAVLAEGYSMFLFPTCQLCIWATCGLFPSNLNLSSVTGLDQKQCQEKIVSKHTDLCIYLSVLVCLFVCFLNLYTYWFSCGRLYKTETAIYDNTNLFSFASLILQDIEPL